MSLQYGHSAQAQNQKTNQSQTNKTKYANATAATPIGNVQQLSKALGNNTKILTSNANIGNPNAGKAASAQQKVTPDTPTNGLTSNPTKAPTKAGSGSANQNKTSGTGNMTNTTSIKNASNSAITNATQAGESIANKTSQAAPSIG
ncbi:MAG: hypothetical protein M3P08_04305 [Thermoproteota archaeon]|nr:hypothetical protein [Thermoproteota archaeon]